MQFLFRFIKEAVVWRCSVEKVFIDILQNSQENTCARVSFLTKLQASKTLVQVFSCEFCKISRNTFFKEQLWATVSVKSAEKKVKQMHEHL